MHHIFFIHSALAGHLGCFHVLVILKSTAIDTGMHAFFQSMFFSGCMLDEGKTGEGKSWPRVQHSENKDHGIRSHHFMANRWGNSGNSVTLFLRAPKSLQMVTAAMKLKDACSLEEKL